MKMDSLLHFDDLSKRLLDHHDVDEISYTDSNNNSNSDSTEYDKTILPKKNDKYSLRPRTLRRPQQRSSVITEQTDSSSKAAPTIKQCKQKQRPAPLSKYRRKTANARERNRMREINQAFETLRQVIPQMQMPQSIGANEKLTKITTLRLAMKYISSLSAVLNGPDVISLSDYQDLDYLLMESDGESLPLSDQSSLLESPELPEPSLSPVDFTDTCLPSLLHTEFAEHSLEADDFSEFLLT